MHSPTISILIPAHNEEVMISNCIRSCLAQTRPADQIVVVNDGSTDRTKEILLEFKDHITLINIPKATGNKSGAQKIGLSCITSEIFVATDADTMLDPHFIEHIERFFMNHTEVAAVAGYVKSTKFNYLTALREIDYTLGQDLYKRAQTHVNFLMVIPGCAGAFKTSLFRDRTVTIEHDTLTEDLDFTYKIHKFGLRVGYEPRAVVYTQDPHTLNSYINQMRRWFGGGWQNLLKHYKIMFQAPGAALQLTMSYLEGLIFSIIFFVLPLINIVLFLQFQLILLCVSLGAGIYAAIRRKRLDLFLYSPLLLVLRGINSWIFIEQLFSEVIFGKKRSIWFQPERRTETLEASLLPHRL